MGATNDDGIDPDDVGSNTSKEPSIGALISRRLGRRDALRGMLGAGAVAAATRQIAGSPAAAQEAGPSSLTFREIAHTLDATQHVPDGYEAQVLIRWGDPVVSDAPAFDPANQTAAAQEKQFGYNNDYIGLHPLPPGGRGSDRFLMVVNHEYVNPDLMFAGHTASTKTQSEIEMAAIGGSVVEIAREGAGWKVVGDSKYARRISVNTPMVFSGPAAGHDLLKTSADPTGRTVFGTLNNCAGGSTPWGTWLTCEENFNTFFGGDASKLADPEAQKRYGVGREAGYNWWRHIDRFNLEKEPNEPNRFGWVVEIDPYDPASIPVKRTTLGRLKHEGCTYALAKDGRVVFYTGDDERFDYVYKFVTSRPWNPTDRAANKNLLDEGMLYAARFNDDGKTEWLPLVQGQGPLTAENGFATQADVLIKTRLAADRLKATPMDRPEDIETNPVNGRVLCRVDQQWIAQGGPGRQGQSAGGQRAWPYHRDRAEGRRSWFDRSHVVDLPAGRQARPGRRRALSSRDLGERLAELPRQYRLRRQGADLDRDRRRAGRRGRCRRSLCRRHGRLRPGPDPAFLPGPDRCRGLRPDLHARRHDILPRRPASRRGQGLDLREALDTLARFQGRHAAPAVGGRHHEEGRRTDRLLRERSLATLGMTPFQRSLSSPA